MSSDITPGEETRHITTTCSYDCGARCVLKVKVNKGQVESITTEKNSELNLAACMRGMAQKNVLYAPDRLSEPLLRTGPRGSGDFKPITWEEALDRVACELKRVIDLGDPRALFLMNYHANEGALHKSMGGGASRFFDFLGGCTTITGNTSFETASFACRTTLGSDDTGSTPDNLLYSKLIVLWGWNPLVSRFRPYTVDYLSRAKAQGTRIICVDPRRSPSVKAFADQWLPIRPGTDTALLIAICYVLIDEELYDSDYVDAYTTGFKEFRAHLMGESDDIVKTPHWAEKITGVPAEETILLARAFAKAKPAALCTGWAPGRTSYGEQFHRAAITLAAITGNIGVVGGNVAGGTDRIPLGSFTPAFSGPRRSNPKVHFADLHDLLLKGKAGGFEADIKLLYLVGSNALNQFPNVGKGRKAFAKPGFIVAHELFMTPTARHADVLLPVTHFLEREDIGSPWMGGPYNIHMQKAVEPMAGTRSDLTIFSQLAERLGLDGYNGKSNQERLEKVAKSIVGLSGLEELRNKGVHRQKLDGPFVAFEDEIIDPANNPFPTPSGKIEILSSRIAEMNHPLLPSLPTYIPSDLANDHPLRLITPHAKTRVNSQFDNIKKIKDKADDKLWMHPEDAASRSIADGNRVLVFNDVGALRTNAYVTNRIMQGVVSLDAGAWCRLDKDGIDDGGCVNTVTADIKSPGGALVANGFTVEVMKA